jgi:hypothetical protein
MAKIEVNYRYNLRITNVNTARELDLKISKAKRTEDTSANKILNDLVELGLEKERELIEEEKNRNKPLKKEDQMNDILKNMNIIKYILRVIEEQFQQIHTTIGINKIMISSLFNIKAMELDGSKISDYCFKDLLYSELPDMLLVAEKNISEAEAKKLEQKMNKAVEEDKK